MRWSICCPIGRSSRPSPGCRNTQRSRPSPATARACTPRRRARARPRRCRWRTGGISSTTSRRYSRTSCSISGRPSRQRPTRRCPTPAAPPRRSRLPRRRRRARPANSRHPAPATTRNGWRKRAADGTRASSSSTRRSADCTPPVRMWPTSLGASAPAAGRSIVTATCPSRPSRSARTAPRASGCSHPTSRMCCTTGRRAAITACASIARFGSKATRMVPRTSCASSPSSGATRPMASRRGPGRGPRRRGGPPPAVWPGSSCAARPTSTPSSRRIWTACWRTTRRWRRPTG